ncbi:unnamed protein product [Mytilus coruscus]|uniref:Uncharacterized protein n=1 Tax=Mytilus coruscus TaxID=42192 RepID=A0A6J8CEB3_MYTCO|nr:unnamed protein product [Mytilus coruscus]
MGWPTSAWFRIQPALQISSPVCVLHWRVMATLVHRLPPSRQDILATEKYSPEDNGLDLVHLHAWNRQFFKVEPVVEVVPAAVVKEVAGEAPKQEEAPQQEEVFEAPKQEEDPKQEEAIAAPRQQEEEIPMEDRHIIILQNGLEKRMVPVCSLRDLRSIAKERFPGRGEGVSPTCNTITGKDPRDLATLVESREIPNGRGDTYVIGPCSASFWYAIDRSGREKPIKTRQDTIIDQEEETPEQRINDTRLSQIGNPNLNYAEVVFEAAEPSTETHIRSLIHGAEDITLYSEIDLLHRASALPSTSESDDHDFMYVDGIEQFTLKDDTHAI